MKGLCSCWTTNQLAARCVGSDAVTRRLKNGVSQLLHLTNHAASNPTQYHIRLMRSLYLLYVYYAWQSLAQNLNSSSQMCDTHTETRAHECIDYTLARECDTLVASIYTASLIVAMVAVPTKQRCALLPHTDSHCLRQQSCEHTFTFPA